MAFRASVSRINIQRQPSLREDVDDPAQLGPLPVQRRRPGASRVKRAASNGKFERRGHYEACGTVKLLLAFPVADDVKPLEQALLAEVGVLCLFITVDCHQDSMTSQWQGIRNAQQCTSSSNQPI